MTPDPYQASQLAGIARLLAIAREQAAARDTVPLAAVRPPTLELQASAGHAPARRKGRLARAKAGMMSLISPRSPARIPRAGRSEGLKEN